MSTQVSVSDGKYIVVIEDNGGLHALRNGERWRDLTGDKMVFCLAYELDAARKLLASLPQPTERRAELSDEQKIEILDWVSACQSQYHIDNTPGHRFGVLGSNLSENRDGLITYIESILAAAAAAPQKGEAA